MPCIIDDHGWRLQIDQRLNYRGAKCDGGHWYELIEFDGMCVNYNLSHHQDEYTRFIRYKTNPVGNVNVECPMSNVSIQTNVCESEPTLSPYNSQTAMIVINRSVGENSNAIPSGSKYNC